MSRLKRTYQDNFKPFASRSWSRQGESTILCRLTGEDQAHIVRLENIPDDNMPADTVIDFIDIDVEVHDLNVLKSNNRENYRAEFIVAETICNGMTQTPASDMAKFMAENDYTLSPKP